MRSFSRLPRTVALTDEATWYKDAIIYEVRARSFFDSNDDGIGDFIGLASKLDYLQDLGVTALWLLPFYPSPGRDDGYDISDYTGVHPDVGTLADFELLLEEAHRRGLRVITELVLNHTSDQHPWFQRARRAPPGSPERNFYVWSPTPDVYRDARIIFKDFEASNWTWDPIAKEYFWHRFYSHQPDLNFENPAVQQALLEVVDYWLEKGVDGLRLDAVPYLYEEEGTNCENLPKTHAFLKKLRAHIDARFKNRMLLAEANQWPEDAAAYFGKGDECHMNLHFPLMPRMFMSLHMEDRLPIVDIFAQTPEVDPSCQWGLFLRNHDELTLEMVTDEERDYMYSAYARSASMRLNLGIRRRLAPLVGNNRRKIELLIGLLFSLPGTPVLYYGDEIGMGDNVYLGDRNGVRTPMQWSMDRNAGFSMANPQGLILPVIIDPEYHYESLNVENQQKNPTSLLWWMKRLIALRKRFGVFGRGAIEFLSPNNARVLVYVREWDDPGSPGVPGHEPPRTAGKQRVLVVANLSRYVQYVELDLAKYEGGAPIELFGQTRFRPIKSEPYMLTLGPHGFYWFSLEPPQAPPARTSIPRAPASSIEGDSIEGVLGGPQIGGALEAFLDSRPWFLGANRAVVAVRVAHVERLGGKSAPVFVVLVRVEYADGEPDSYVVPIAAPEPLATGERPSDGVIAEAIVRGERRVLVDALEDPASSRSFLLALAEASRSPTRPPSVIVTAPRGLVASESDVKGDPKKVGRGIADTTVIYDERFVLQLFRRVERGLAPELELGRFLADQGAHVTPRLEAAIELSAPPADAQTVGLLFAYVPHVETGWAYTLEALGRFYDQALARAKEALPAPPHGQPLDLVLRQPPAVVLEMTSVYLDSIAQLARRVAHLHLELASGTDPAFLPEPYTPFDRRSKYQSLRNLSGGVLRLLRERNSFLAPRARREADSLLQREGELLARFAPLLHLKTTAPRIRVHGDLHLGHVLFTGKDFVLTGLAGNRSASSSARARKRSVLRDLASMVRSFDFAAFRVLLDPARVRESDIDAAHPWAVQWTSWVCATFLRTYLEATAGAAFIPREPGETAALFEAFLLERALHQLEHQLLAHVESPQVAVPLLGIAHVLAGGARGAEPGGTLG